MSDLVLLAIYLGLFIYFFVALIQANFQVTKLV